MKAPLALSIALVLGFARGAIAQGADGSPMGQGQASINVRSDVTLAIKGERATPTARLEQLTDVATSQMPGLRKCYRDLIAKHSTSVGSISARVTLEQGNAPPELQIKENGGTEPELTACVRRRSRTRAPGQADPSSRRDADDRVSEQPCQRRA